MSSDYLDFKFRYEKDRETAAGENSCFTTSQNGEMKAEIKSSKLFERTLASLNIRYIFLLCALKSSEISQFSHVKAGLFHVSHIQHQLP